MHRSPQWRLRNHLERPRGQLSSSSVLCLSSFTRVVSMRFSGRVNSLVTKEFWKIGPVIGATALRDWWATTSRKAPHQQKGVAIEVRSEPFSDLYRLMRRARYWPLADIPQSSLWRITNTTVTRVWVIQRRSAPRKSNNRSSPPKLDDLLSKTSASVK